MAAVEKPRAPKAPKEKKTKGSKPSAPSHPPYFQMIKEAILALREKNGSSTYAIAKHMEEKHNGVLPPNYKKMLALQLKNFAAKGKLVKVKASFKLSESGKKDDKQTKEKKVAKEKMPKEKKPKEATSGSTKRKASAAGAVPKKKPATSTKSPKDAKSKKAKKSVSAKPKQPKPIKSSIKKAKKDAA